MKIALQILLLTSLVLCGCKGGSKSDSSESSSAEHAYCTNRCDQVSAREESIEGMWILSSEIRATPEVTDTFKYEIDDTLCIIYNVTKLAIEDTVEHHEFHRVVNYGGFYIEMIDTTENLKLNIDGGNVLDLTGTTDFFLEEGKLVQLTETISELNSSRNEQFGIVDSVVNHRYTFVPYCGELIPSSWGVDVETYAAQRIHELGLD